jgi:poly(3-hydroxybutyrate) depolymerase
MRRRLPGAAVGRTPKFLGFKSVEDTIKICAKANGCPDEPSVTKLPDKAGDGTSVTKKTYGPGKDGSEVVLLVIEGGGQRHLRLYATFAFTPASIRRRFAAILSSKIWTYPTTVTS